MNWKLIFVLSVFGIAMGLLSVFVYCPPVVEFVLWLVITVVSAVVIARYAPGKYFLHGFCVAVLNTVWVTAAQAGLFFSYIATHPEYLQMTAQLPEALSGHPRRLIVYKAPIIAILSGLLFGLFAWVASKIVKRG
jgi:uncharacterized membrane protein